MGDAQVLFRELDDPRRFVRVPDRCVFDEHSEFDARGKLIRKFDRADLEEIAASCNRRDATGTLSPIAIGHTIPNEGDERKQPPLVGYARNYRVSYDKTLGKWVLRADFYIRKDHFDEAKTFPRVSIELWPGRRHPHSDKWIEPPVIDPVSLLRRTPQRDLGQWTFARGDVRRPLGISTWRYSRTAPTVLRYSMIPSWIGGASMAGKQPRRYERDDSEGPDVDIDLNVAPEDFDSDGDVDDLDVDVNVDDADSEAGETPPTPEEHESYAKHCAHHYAKMAGHPSHKRMMKCYGKAEEAGNEGLPDLTVPPDAGIEENPDQFSAMATPSATNAPPMKKGEDEPIRNARRPAANSTRNQASTSTRKYRQGSDPRLYRRIEELERQNKEIAQREAEKAAENWALVLEDEGYEIDEDPADGDIANLALCYSKGGDESCERYADKVRRHRRVRIDHPVGQIRTVNPHVNGTAPEIDFERNPEQIPQKDMDAIERYQKQHAGEGSYDWSLAELAARALPLKYGKRQGNHTNGTTQQNGHTRR